MAGNVLDTVRADFDPKLESCVTSIDARLNDRLKVSDAGNISFQANVLSGENEAPDEQWFLEFGSCGKELEGWL